MSKKPLNKPGITAIGNAGLITILGIFVLVVGIFVGTMLKDGSDSRTRVHAVQDSFSDHTLKIAGDFRCSCGNCGEKNLAVCTCETALIEKRYIENSLKAGKSHRQITDEVKKIYGLYNGG